MDLINFLNFKLCSLFNILLIGDSRVGKSTFINSLFSDRKLDLYSNTLNPILHSLGYSFNNNLISINIIDTPGLSEISMDNGLSRSDNEVLNIVTNYTKNNFSYINMILIAISNNCITEGVVSMMYDLLKFIGIKYHNNICLLITHCDNFSEKDEIEFIKSLSQNLAMKSFLVRINYRIIYTGKKELINPSDSNIFIERQVRFRTNFVNTLKLLDKTNLHNYNDLENVSPFDILESSIKINSVILTIPEKKQKF